MTKYNKTVRGQFEPNVAMQEFHARAPVDRKTACILGKGVQFVFSKNHKSIEEWRIQPALSAMPEGVADLSGQRFGRMVVVGYWRKKKRRMPTDANTYWIVRCGCGVYAYRTAKAIKNKNNSFDCCHQCRHILFIRRRHLTRSLGREVYYEEIVV